MKIVVFGASGGTGRQVVRQAADAGHQVTAVIRAASRAEFTGEPVVVERADVMAPDALVPVVAGQDAVVSVIGSRGRRVPTRVQSDAASAIITAMRAGGVRRLLVVSNSGMIDDGQDGPLTRLLVKPVLRRVLRHPWADMREMERRVRDSDLDWTLVRPPMLTDGPLTGTYRQASGQGLRGGVRISRADLAHCMVGSLADPRTIRSVITVGN
ncbi:NAD(P)-dependent oxidoreductase [Streptomyces sp. NPDC087425]|uniref:NAD(P)-dependent oxidoreductase n=1 Tax=Streptomyces sp. NPDC087425 TaxID=3365787 RepID=UPI0038245485